jgi:hypothetical protein
MNYTRESDPPPVDYPAYPYPPPHATIQRLSTEVIIKSQLHRSTIWILVKYSQNLRYRCSWKNFVRIKDDHPIILKLGDSPLSYLFGDSYPGMVKDAISVTQ